MVGEDDIAARLARIQVDVRHLDGIKQYLAELMREVEHAKGEAAGADGSVRGPGPAGGSAFGSREIPVVADLTRCLVGTRDTVATNLTNLTTAHQQTGDGIARIAELYQTVETRNRLAAEEVGKLLKGG